LRWAAACATAAFEAIGSQGGVSFADAERATAGAADTLSAAMAARVFLNGMVVFVGLLVRARRARVRARLAPIG
jgi:hypothetical protein